MKKRNAAAILAGVVALVFIATSTSATYAGGNGWGTKRANSSTCKSGKAVNNAKNCKENGGTN